MAFEIAAAQSGDAHSTVRRVGKRRRSLFSEFEIVPLNQMPRAARFCCRYLETWWSEPRVVDERLVDLCMVSERLPFILVAKHKRSVLGVIMAEEHNTDVSPKYRPWLMMLYVKKRFRGRKVGTQLVASACDRLRQLGYNKAYIDTTTAHGFFQKLGWRFVEHASWRAEITSIFMTELAPERVTVK